MANEAWYKAELCRGATGGEGGGGGVDADSIPFINSMQLQVISSARSLMPVATHQSGRFSSLHRVLEGSGPLLCAAIIMQRVHTQLGVKSSLGKLWEATIVSAIHR